jgi:hypothetical protein
MSWKPLNARMRKLWNVGDSSLSDIAAAVGLPVDEVEAYLHAQPGFPDVIDARPATCQAPSCGREFAAWHKAQRYCSDRCRHAGTTRRWRECQRRKRESAVAQAMERAP